MATQDSNTEKFFNWAGNVTAAATAAVMKDGTIKASAREAVKDVRSTIMDAFFGQKEGLGEPGAPLNPTQGEIAEERNSLPSPAQIADRNGPAAQSQGQDGKGWQEREQARQQKKDQAGNGGEGQNEQAKGRSLPQEQKQKEEQGRGR